MTVQIERFRVPVDFPSAERDALDALCKSDYRPPAEQIRWLVVTEAKRRGLIPATNGNDGAKDLDTQRAAVPTK